MNIRIDKTAENQRLDRFIMKYFKDMKRTAVFKLIRKKKIKVNKGKSTPEYLLQLEDEVWIDDYVIGQFSEKKVVELKGELSIVYEDEEILVLYKPQGLKTTPDREGELSLTGLVQTYLKDNVTQTFSPSPVSRLDRNTSGLVLFGKTYESLKELSSLMRNREIKKYYLAIIFGTIEGEKEVKMRLSKDQDEKKMLEDEEGKEAITIIHPVISGKDYSLVELDLVTGRTHQIRVALSSIGHPIVGDPKYGKGGKGQMLTAYRIVIKNKEITYISQDFETSIKEYVDDHFQRPTTNSIKKVSL